MQKSYFFFRRAKLAYTDEGQGPPLLFLPGFLEHSAMWSSLCHQLLEGWRKLSLDLPGHGQSENLGYSHSMEEMAGAVQALVDHLKLREVVLCGHSMGGYVGLALLEHHPATVRGLILMNSAPFPDSTDRKDNRRQAIKLVRRDPAAYVRRAIPLLFAPSSRKDFPEAVMAAQEQGQETSARGMVAALEGMRIRPDRQAILRRSTIPKMIIAGWEDPIIPWEQLQEKADDWGLRLVTVRRGHMSHWEDPSGVCRALEEFMGLI